jgi:hypothetical protein
MTDALFRSLMLSSHAGRSGDEERRANRLMPDSDPSCCSVMQEGHGMRKGGQQTNDRSPMLSSHAEKSGDEEGRTNRLMADPPCCPVMQEGQDMRNGVPAVCRPHVVHSCRKVRR